MSFLDKLDDWPSPERTRLMLILSIIITIGAFLLISLFIFLSRGSADMIASELSFSAFRMKFIEYLPMVLFGDIGAYRIAEILDYGFMFGYGSLIFSVALIIGRKFDPTSRWRKMGYIFAISGILAACLDVFENLFILLTLTNPLGFPDWWTVAQSIFSLPKWIIIIAAIVWAIIAAIKSKL